MVAGSRSQLPPGAGSSRRRNRRRRLVRWRSAAPQRRTVVAPPAPPEVEVQVRAAQGGEPKTPEIIVLPAGPMLDKPRPAKLSGPQVVRVEAPEPMDRPTLPVQAAPRCSRSPSR